MAIKVLTLREQDEASRSTWTSDRRLWLTADKQRVVEDGDPEAAFQYTTPGITISMLEAIRYGLAPTSKAASKPADKAVHGAEDK